MRQAKTPCRLPFTFSFRHCDYMPGIPCMCFLFLQTKLPKEYSWPEKKLKISVLPDSVFDNPLQWDWHRDTCSFENAKKKTCKHFQSGPSETADLPGLWEAVRAYRYVVPTVAGLNCFTQKDNLRDELNISDCYRILRLAPLFTISVWGFWDYQTSQSRWLAC